MQIRARLDLIFLEDVGLRFPIVPLKLGGGYSPPFDEAPPQRGVMITKILPGRAELKGVFPSSWDPCNTTDRSQLREYSRLRTTKIMDFWQ